jgi:hypothetical protein
VIQQLNRSVTRSAPKPAIPQIIDKVGVPDVKNLNTLALMYGVIYEDGTGTVH